MAATPREHIEEIRKFKFSIGGEPNPLSEDLYHAVRNLSAELYTKDVHFLMELIQNAEDNEYLPGVDPALEFVFTSNDITGTGAPATLIVFNNEIGFSRRNIESICSVGRSTKKEKRQGGFIGEKGIGFKSVFLVTAQPYIFSNGYQIRFSEEPISNSSIGYIVPEWVDSKPTFSDIHDIYGTQKTLPTTAIILPLRHDKVEAVKLELSNVHPELLLFLLKIKRLSVHETNVDHCTSGSVSEISILSETDFRTIKDIDADSRILYLSATEGSAKSSEQCNYYIWRQRFPVKDENRVEGRKEIEEWVISLAFPFGDRLKRRSSSSGVFAFLPTEMVTNFTFIIQADFILSSSRETILLDNKWNNGILQCVPTAFVNAIVSSVKSVESAPLSSVASIFNFLPIQTSSYAVLNDVRHSIKARIRDEHIIPCESFSTQRVFCKPVDAGRLLPAFREILFALQEQGINLKSISSHGKHIIHSALDVDYFKKVLDFLGVKYVDYDWYGKYVQGSNLVLLASEDVYMELLCFLSDNWKSGFGVSSVADTPILKYIDQYEKLELCSVKAAKLRIHKIHFAKDAKQHAWLNKWKREFQNTGSFFFPNSTQMALLSFNRIDLLMPWLCDTATVEETSVYSFCHRLIKTLRSEKHKNLVIAFTHFVFHSFSNLFITEQQVAVLCKSMPVVKGNGHVAIEWSKIMVPAIGSAWEKLLGSNPWRGEKYIELGEEYSRPGDFAGERTSEKQMMPFLQKYFKATDIPELCPPDAELPNSSQMTKDQAFLLLDWIRNLRTNYILLPRKFKKSIETGKWLKTIQGFASPNQCFLSDGDAESILANIADISIGLPFIDGNFYGNKIISYKEDLKIIGVKYESVDACRVIADRVSSLAAASVLTRETVLSLLKFVKYLRGNYMLTDYFVESLKGRKWLKTVHGYRTPVGSVFLVSENETVKDIANLPFVDETYYGREIHCYSDELKLLGVVVELVHAYELIAENFIFKKGLSAMTSNHTTLILRCIRELGTSAFKLIEKIQNQSWLKTTTGFSSPSESILPKNHWSCLLNIVSGMPVIDETFYGSNIHSFKAELQALGVTVNFDKASKIIADQFKSLSSSTNLTKGNVLLLLKCLRKLRGQHYSSLPKEFNKCMEGVKWLKTLCGYRSSQDSLLFNSKWVSLSNVCELPFIDESYYGEEIYSYREELKMLGVVVDHTEGLKFVAPCIKFPREPSEIAPEYVISLLECIRSMNSNQNPGSSLTRLIQKIRDKRWLRTTVGIKSPNESSISHTELDCLLNVLDIPVIDETFYGRRIQDYKAELKMLGVKVSFIRVFNRIASCFKLLSSSSSLTKDHVLNLLECFKSLRGTQFTLPMEFNNCLVGEKWIKTHHGYSTCEDSVLFYPNWDSISLIADIPFVDDAFYSKSIYLYREELRMLGVIVTFADGCHFVAKSLKLPKEPAVLSVSNVLSLLECVRSLLERSDQFLPDFLSKLKSTNWLLTPMGYRSPEECLYFDSKWATVLEPEDAPFIIESFYGASISLYREELKAVGVKFEFRKGCSLIAGLIGNNTNFSSLRRIYSYLNMCRWKPENKLDFRIWIPKNSTDGEWVMPDSCVIYDVDNLFCSRLNVLRSYYDKSLLQYFSSAFQVPHVPLIEDYFRLWYHWENSRHKLTHAKCCSFWSHVLTWGHQTVKDFGRKITKLPTNNHVCGEVQLVNKENVFIPDVLQMMDMFSRSCKEPLFVWYPQPSLPSLPLCELYKTYKILGVRNISEAVTEDSLDSTFMNSNFKKLESRGGMIGEGLIRLVLGFLAEPRLQIPVVNRHKIARDLLDLSVYETDRPIVVSYSLIVSSEEKHLSAKSSRMVCFEKSSSRLIVQASSTSHEKTRLKFATFFAKEVSEGLLWERTELIDGLFKLIRLGCLLGFEVDAVNTLLKMENLQVFFEDEQFLSSEFSFW
ncbi:uncharacterized protein LOC143861623 [Tasmannia lanceolata]|uniref:uncharacterized protein LOC143861623 n=1 Tax=Tasmannia lanceolata TaxID=3420 RepID=UPI0040648F98